MKLELKVATTELPTLTSRAAYSTPAAVAKGATRFTYRIAASYSGKGQRLNPIRNTYEFNSVNISAIFEGPQGAAKATKKKRPASGQDSFFVGNVGDTGGVAFGVADGVGGWVESGIDPADFAHSLCNYMGKAAARFPAGFKTQPMAPQELLQIGFEKVMKDDSVPGGGSTACIATANVEGRLDVANLGDSGFLQLRQNAVRYHSPAQTHAFNTPYQLSKVPKRMLVQEAVFGVTRFSETPKDADLTSHQLQHGDVLVFASDGVWDNLSPEDTLNLASRQLLGNGGWVEKSGDEKGGSGGGVQPGERLGYLTYTPGASSEASGGKLQETLAVLIAGAAKNASMDLRRDGPFAKEVKKRFPNENYHGGKVDDIVVVVVVVIEEPV
ncbi:protein serine/threonine phosphatase 2C [Viridothelium virens]|uniref:Protein phosphatase n=1 Tax=Viridothelium virens TaxID=1048519 RepID=A0A6A6GTE4_VIRVR|nr:protein serine/threonine phosphatase 2C [Viridothelium virens]